MTKNKSMRFERRSALLSKTSLLTANTSYRMRSHSSLSLSLWRHYLPNGLSLCSKHHRGRVLWRVPAMPSFDPLVSNI
jgi:hypothetical protein